MLVYSGPWAPSVSRREGREGRKPYHRLLTWWAVVGCCGLICWLLNGLEGEKVADSDRFSLFYTVQSFSDWSRALRWKRLVIWFLPGDWVSSDGSVRGSGLVLVCRSHADALCEHLRAWNTCLMQLCQVLEIKWKDTWVLTFSVTKLLWAKLITGFNFERKGDLRINMCCVS